MEEKYFEIEKEIQELEQQLFNCLIPEEEAKIIIKLRQKYNILLYKQY